MSTVVLKVFLNIPLRYFADFFSFLIPPEFYKEEITTNMHIYNIFKSNV